MSFPYHSELLFLQRTEVTSSQDICIQYKKWFWGCEEEGQKQKSVYLAPKCSPVNSETFFLYYMLFCLYLEAVRNQLQHHHFTFSDGEFDFVPQNKSLPLSDHDHLAESWV